MRSHYLVRHGRALLLALVAVIFAAPMVEARYRRPDVDKVPVDRLVENLEKLAKKDPKDLQARFNLARVHAMAYALKTDTAEVLKDKADQGAWFGYEPKPVPFAVKPTDDPAQKKAAREHLDKAIARYEEVIKADPNHLAARLGHAWSMEQSAQKDKAIAEYRKLIEDAWGQEKDLKRAPLGWHSITAETAQYLMPLLSADKEKQEIATLQDRIKHVRAIPRPITPIVIPLREGLAVRDLVDRSARVAFDADGSGLPQTWTWISKDAGWLVYDPQRTGKVSSALQLFGGVTFWLFWENGYEAMGALDDDDDGMLSAKELDGLAIWQDLNGNGRSEPGEVKSLTDWGIVKLSCRHAKVSQQPDHVAESRQGVSYRDGSSRPTYDVILNPR